MVSSDQPEDHVPETQPRRESVEEIYARNFSEPLRIYGFSDDHIRAAVFRQRRRDFMQTLSPMDFLVDPTNNYMNQTTWQLLKCLMKAWVKNMAMDIITIAVLLLFGILIIWAIFKE